MFYILSIHPCTITHDVLHVRRGVCSDKVKLPTVGFEYDPDALIEMLSLPLSDLFAQNPQCGSSQLLLQNNRAGRYGGGLFQQACDKGLQV